MTSRIPLKYARRFVSINLCSCKNCSTVDDSEIIHFPITHLRIYCLSIVRLQSLSAFRTPRNKWSKMRRLIYCALSAATFLGDVTCRCTMSSIMEFAAACLNMYTNIQNSSTILIKAQGNNWKQVGDKKELCVWGWSK